MDESSSLVDRLSELLWFCDFLLQSGSKQATKDRYSTRWFEGYYGTAWIQRQDRAGKGKAVLADHHPPTILILAYDGWAYRVRSAQ